MKQFETLMTILAVFLIALMTISMSASLFEQHRDFKYVQKVLQRENRQLELEVELRDNMFGKYADSVSDEMLRDFYPQASNTDSLRSCLKEKYEIYLRTQNDGLCY